MKLSNKILEDLASSIKRNPSLSDVEADEIKKACQLIEDQLSPYPNWDAIIGDQNTNQSIISLVNSCIVTGTFDPKVAQEKILCFRIENKTALQKVSLTQIDNIQEKFLKSQLTDHEVLTDMDVRRFVDATGMDESIYVATLNKDEIEVILRDQKNKDSIGLMINIGNEGMPPQPTWIAVTITFNPMSRLISYKVKHSADLTQTQIEKIQSTLKESGTFNLIHSEILALQSQPIKKNSGYDVLHALYKEESLRCVIADQKNAENFATTDSADVKKQVYRTELEAIQLSPEDVELQNEQMKRKFDVRGCLTPAAINEQLTFLEKAPPAEQSVSALVADAISTMKPGLSQLIFPGDDLAEPLRSVDYFQYLLAADKKFTDPQTHKKYYPDKILLNNCDIDVLEGLIAYSVHGNTFPCHTLELDLTNLKPLNDNQVQMMLYRMKTLLVSAADVRLPTLNIVDNKNILSKNTITELTNFICDRKIPIDFCLPTAYQHSNEQKRIDRQTSEAIRLRNVTEVGQKAAARASAEIEGLVRTRPRPKEGEKVRTQVDIELQEEQQVEVAVETSVEVSVAASVDGEAGDGYNIEQFCEDMRCRNLKGSRVFLQPSDKASAQALWMNWVGALTLHDAQNKSVRLSKSACEEMLQYYEFYQYGLDLNRLPPGFIQQANGQISFDPALKSASDYDPLRIQTGTISEYVPLTFSQVEKVLDSFGQNHPASDVWNQINNGPEGYRRDATPIFRQFLPQLLQLGLDEQKALLELCCKPTFDGKKFKFLLINGSHLKKLWREHPYDKNLEKTIKDMEEKSENKIRNFINDYLHVYYIPFEKHALSVLIEDSLKEKVANWLQEKKEFPVYLNALFTLYVERGETGLNQLLFDLENDNAHIRQWMLPDARTYTPLLDPAFRESLSYIDQLLPQDKIWWDRMLKQHREAQPDFNLVDLVNAFRQFKNELAEISTANNIFPPLRLPEHCKLEGVKSMPVALSRILALVKKCKPENQQAQLNEASCLDLSSTGAIKTVAASNKTKWAYVCAEMQLTRENECKRFPATRQYGWSNFQSEITEYGSKPDFIIEINEEKNSTDISELYRLFFCSVATQDGVDQQLPLEFYRHVQQTVNDHEYDNTSIMRHLIGDSPNRIRASICFLMAAATTGDNRQSIFLNTEEAKSQFDIFIDVLKDKKDREENGVWSILPKSNIKMVIVIDNLLRLNRVPPLPTLVKLATLIKSGLTLMNAGELIVSGGQSGTLSRLIEAQSDLNRYVSEYKYGFNVYNGLKDYTKTDYADKELFYNHLDMINLIIKRGDLDDDIKPKLMTAISTFHLKKESLHSLLDRLSKPSSDDVKAAWLNLIWFYLPKIASQGTKLPTLSPEDLNNILTAVEDRVNRWQDEKKTFDDNHLVEETLNELKLNGVPLKKYLPEYFIENKMNPGIPPRVKTLIESEFPENLRPLVSRILYHFQAAGDNNYYMDVVNKLTRITADMDHMEKSTFLRKLNGEPGLYLPSMSVDGAPILLDEMHPFVILLNDMIAKGPADFLNLLAATNGPAFKHDIEADASLSAEARAERRAALFSHLSQKVHIYIKLIVPPFRSTVNASISLLDLEPRIQATLLKTPPESLENRVATELPEEKHYERYLDILAQTLTVTGIRKEDFKEKKISFAVIDIKSLTEAGNVFIEKADPNNRASQSLQNFLAEVSAEYANSKEKMQSVATSPGFFFLTQPLAQTRSEKQPEALKKVFMKHPSIIKDLQLLQVLLANPGFCKNLTSDALLKDLNNSKLMFDDDALDRVFTAIENDVARVSRLRNLILATQESVQKSYNELHTYPRMMVALFRRINSIAAENPCAKRQFLELYDAYLAKYSPDANGADFFAYISRFVLTLEKAFAAIPNKNKDIVFSLCLQFTGKYDDELTPVKLLELLDLLDGISSESNAALLKMAIALINNEKNYTFNAFKDIVDIVKLEEKKNGKSQFAEFIKVSYSNAPFPTMENIRSWDKSYDQKIDYANFMQSKYDAFNTHPCHREIWLVERQLPSGLKQWEPVENKPTDEDIDSRRAKPLNGFHASVAETQLNPEIFKGFDCQKINLNKFQEMTTIMRSMKTKDLLEKLKSFKGIELTDGKCQELVAVAAELFYRSKGKDHYYDPEQHLLKPGSSMEINTTQYLAILTALMTDGHVTSQIGTGEGKSRIMMISNVCQFALGKTVDFVTSDAQLATRDYVEYQAYFEMVGAKTSMIFANSDPSSYCIGGINFSDPSNLSLFRNKARSTGYGKIVIDPSRKNRALLLDEADKTYFDVANTRFNFSKEGDESIQGMEWVYPLLMDYFNGSDERMNLYFENIDQSREDFLAFVRNSLTAAERTEKMLRLTTLPNAQIEQWQVSAVTAAQLKFNKDFVIEPDILIATNQGPKIASEAQLLAANRVSKNSKFSFGVHQCLHAWLNIQRQNPEAVMAKAQAQAALLRKTEDKEKVLQEAKKLCEALAKCEEKFHVADEKQIIYSSTSKNLLDDYSEGTLKAVTGTAGSLIERQEAAKLYGFKPIEGSYHEMNFIVVPRDKSLRRDDHPIRLTGNKKQQIDVLIAQIKLARANNQPILVIAENYFESADLFERLKDEFKDCIQLIHNQLSLEDEKNCIDCAGVARQITVSTDMIGRGTDIKLQGQARDHGLNVMLTYLPRPRDLEQIIGRSGRAGDKGETSLVLDKERLKKQLGKKSLRDGFYSNTEAYIKRQQALMDRRNQCERLIDNTVGDFRRSLIEAFYEGILQKVEGIENQRKLIPAWTTFFDKSDKAWNELWPQIQQQLQKKWVDTERISTLLQQYEVDVRKYWTALRRDVQNAGVPIPEIYDIGNLKLSRETLELFKNFKIEDSYSAKERVFDRYEPAHEGRAVKYSHWSIPWIAFAKGWANLLPFVNYPENEVRRPFANFRAWAENHGILFPELRALTSRNRARVISGVIGGLLCAAVGVTLIATGILAPFGVVVAGLSVTVTSAAIVGIGCFVAGTLVGVASVATAETLIPVRRNRKPADKNNHHLDNRRNSSAFITDSFNKTSYSTEQKSDFDSANHRSLDENNSFKCNCSDDEVIEKVKTLLKLEYPVSVLDVKDTNIEIEELSWDKKNQKERQFSLLSLNEATALTDRPFEVKKDAVSKLILVSVKTGAQTKIYMDHNQSEAVNLSSNQILWETCDKIVFQHKRGSNLNNSFSVNAHKQTTPLALLQMMANYCDFYKISFTVDGAKPESTVLEDEMAQFLRSKAPLRTMK